MVEVPKNTRQVLLLANSDATVQPLVIVFPSWSRDAMNTLSRQRQLELYDEFVHVVSAEWEKLMRHPT